MKILLVAKPWRGGLADYVLRALRKDFGDKVSWMSTHPVGPVDKLAYRLSKSNWRQRLMERIQRGGYDLVLCINHLPEYAELEYSARRVIWLTDDPRPVAGQLAAFSIVLLSDPGYREECRAFLRADQQLAVLPFACDPELHSPGNRTPLRGMCFVANRDKKRDLHLRHLFTSGRSVDVYGNYFGQSRLFWESPMAFRPAVPFTRLGEIYRHYAASLNIHADVVRAGTNMRTFECAAFSIPQLVEYRPGLEEVFAPEEEILVYRDFSELESQYDRLLNDATLRTRLSENARLRALSQHTYKDRLKFIFEAIL